MIKRWPCDFLLVIKAGCIEMDLLWWILTKSFWDSFIRNLISFFLPKHKLYYCYFYWCEKNLFDITKNDEICSDDANSLHMFSIFNILP